MASFNWGRDVNIHTKQVLNVSWNCDGHYLAGSSDKTVKIGQLDTGGLKMMKNGNFLILHLHIPVMSIYRS